MDLSYAVEVSSFFLIESSGDSEEDFDSVVCLGCNSASSLAEDDAESCCSGSSDVAYLEDCSEIDNEDDSRDGGGYEQECDGSSDGDHGSWICQDEKLLEDASESMQSDKQKTQLLTEEDARMNEEEKNRLFWESCFAE